METPFGKHHGRTVCIYELLGTATLMFAVVMSAGNALYVILTLWAILMICGGITGGHFNPAMKQHGKDNPLGSHAGDMPNFTVGPKGTAKATITNSAVTLGDGATSLFTNGGTALVVHAGPDDMKTDPAGAAGDRIACGVITK